MGVDPSGVLSLPVRTMRRTDPTPSSDFEVPLDSKPPPAESNAAASKVNLDPEA